MRPERRSRSENIQVLVVDDEPDIRELLDLTLARMGLACHCAGSVAEAKRYLEAGRYQLCLTDMRLPDGEGIELVRHIGEHCQDLPVAVITAHGSMENAVQALKAGAFDYLAKPVSLDQLRALVKSAIDLPQTSARAASSGAEALFGNSPAIQQARTMIERVARSQAPVYISGESGSGKELAASLIHRLGARREKSFIAVNCGAIPETLMESEFFGHRKGAFTGAESDRDGFFQAADGGTLFLDEVGDLPLAMQVKLLRVLQERQVVRLGSRKPIPVDVRLVAATNVNLEKAVQAGHFRLDLYYRLNVAPVELPPLRERPGDILPLVEYFIDFYRQRLDIPTPRLSQEAAAELVAYHWPGNIRELENVVHFALIVCQNGVVNPGDLRLPGFALSPPGATPDPGGSHADGFATVRAGLRRLLDEDTPEVYERIEQLLFTTAFEYCRENQVRTAKQLGISRNILRTQLKRFGLIGDTAADALAAADA